MAIEKSKIINVLNYNENPVCIKTHMKEYICQKSENGVPSITPLEFSEVESLNSNSPVFKIGNLFFEEGMQEEIYNEIRLLEWKDILRNEDIEKILLYPSLDGLSKIVNIKSVMLFERVRGIFFSLKNSNQHDLSTRVENVINTRYKELCNRQLNTKIILTAKDTTSKASTEEVSDLKKQNESLQVQMCQMQKMMEQMMAMQNSNAKVEKQEPVGEEKKVNPKSTQSKKVGRPSTK